MFDHQEELDQYLENIEALIKNKQYARLRDLFLPMEPADIANTVLKMAEKRAFVDAIRTTSGSTARALAMQSRCIWPLESERALSSSRSLTSSQSAAPFSAVSQASWSLVRFRSPWILRP